MKKNNIIEAATYFFATQGFDGTTTKAISDQAGVTEPLLYYHFTGKDEIYTTILEAAFTDYSKALKELNKDTKTAFDKIENLLALHFDLVKKIPHEMSLVVSSKPSKLNDPEEVYDKQNKKHRKWLKSYLTRCLKKGVATKEFGTIPVKETANLIMMVISAILQKKDYQNTQAMRQATVDFWRKNLC